MVGDRTSKLGTVRIQSGKANKAIWFIRELPFLSNASLSVLYAEVDIITLLALIYNESGPHKGSTSTKLSYICTLFVFPRSRGNEIYSQCVHSTQM